VLLSRAIFGKTYNSLNQIKIQNLDWQKFNSPHKMPMTETVYVIALVPGSLQHCTTFFAFSLIIEGTTVKELQFKMPLKSIYNKTFALLNKKCIFEHNREVQTIKNL
jgi:hypothetical protein